MATNDVQIVSDGSSDEEFLFVDPDDHIDQRDVVLDDVPELVLDGNRVIVQADNYLHPCFKYRDGLPGLGPEEPYPTSVEMIYWYIALKVNGYKTVAYKLLRDDELRENNFDIATWMKHFEIVLHPYWFRLAHNLYHDIILNLVRQNHNFGKVLMNYVVDPTWNCRDKVTFALVTPVKKNFTFTTGYRIGQLKQYCEADDFPGINSYGDALTEVAMSRHKRNDAFKVGSPSLWLQKVQEPSYQFKYTVLVLGDSQCKYLEIQQGYVISISGGTLSTVLAELDNRGIALSDFMYIVIACGFNDSQKSYQVQLAGVEALKTTVAPLLESRKNFDFPTVLLSLPFGVPGFTNLISAYVTWTMGRIESLNGLDVLDWSKDNPFVNFEGKLQIPWFEDRIHLSHHGFGRLYKFWSTRLDGLRSIPYNLNSKPYKQSRFLPEPYVACRMISDDEQMDL